MLTRLSCAANGFTTIHLIGTTSGGSGDSPPFSNPPPRRMGAGANELRATFPNLFGACNLVQHKMRGSCSRSCVCRREARTGSSLLREGYAMRGASEKRLLGTDQARVGPHAESRHQVKPRQANTSFLRGRVMKLIPLSMWAKRRYEKPPSARTLRRWRAAGNIYPRPRKEGGTYYVVPDAVYVDPTDPDYLSEAKARESSSQ